MATPALPRILVVDDDGPGGRAMARTFERCAATVTLSEGVDHAMELLRAGQRFELVVSDVMMPGKTGPEFFELATALVPELRPCFVFVTAGAPPEQASRISGLGIRCLRKPIPLPTIHALVAEALTRRR